MAAIRDSNRWADLEEQADLDKRSRRFLTHVGGTESGYAMTDSEYLLDSKEPTRSLRRVRSGQVTDGQDPSLHGRIGWVSGHVFPKVLCDPPAFEGYRLPPTGVRRLGECEHWQRERPPRNSRGPLVDPNHLNDDGMHWSGNTFHTRSGTKALKSIPAMQRTALELPLARSAAVNSVLHYVMRIRAPQQ